MRIATGAIIFLFGLIAFGHSIVNMHVGISPAGIFGRLLPSGVIVVLGVVVLAWRKKKKEVDTK